MAAFPAPFPWIARRMPEGKGWEVFAASSVNGAPGEGALVATHLAEEHAKLIAAAERTRRERDHFRDALENILDRNGADGAFGQIAGEAIGTVDNALR